MPDHIGKQPDLSHKHQVRKDTQSNIESVAFIVFLYLSLEKSIETTRTWNISISTPFPCLNKTFASFAARVLLLSVFFHLCGWWNVQHTKKSDGIVCINFKDKALCGLVVA